MKPQRHNEIIDNIKTLDEAKQLILHLLESEEHIFQILLYELRTPLMAIKGYADIAQVEEYLVDRVYFLKIISNYAGGITKSIEVLHNEINTGWLSYRKSFLELFPLQSVDMNPILMETKSQIQRSVDFQNESHSHNQEVEQRKGIIRPPAEPVKLEARIDENLPAVQFNSAILDFMMSDIAWFLSVPYRGDIFISSSADEQWVKITFIYTPFVSVENIQDDFQRFERVQTAYEFAGESLFLYNIWRRLKAYGAELSLNFQEKNVSNKSSKLEVTMSLKR